MAPPRTRCPGEGLSTVLASPWLWVTIAVAGISNITYAGPMEVGLPFLIRDHLHAAGDGGFALNQFGHRLTRLEKQGLNREVLEPGKWVLLQDFCLSHFGLLY